MGRGKRNSNVTLTLSNLTEVLRGIGLNASDVEIRTNYTSALRSSWFEQVRVSDKGVSVIKITDATLRKAEAAAGELGTPLLPEQRVTDKSPLEAEERCDLFDPTFHEMPPLPTDVLIEGFLNLLSQASDGARSAERIKELEDTVSTLKSQVGVINPAALAAVKNAGDILELLVDFGKKAGFEANMLNGLLTEKVGMNFGALEAARVELSSHFPEAFRA